MDYKVATDEAREDRYQEQLRVYTVAGRGEGLTSRRPTCMSCETAPELSVDITGPMTQQAVERLRDGVATLRRSEFVPKPQVDRCQSCEYRAVCAHAAVDDQGD